MNFDPKPGRVGIAYHVFGFMRVICADVEWMKRMRTIFTRNGLL